MDGWKLMKLFFQQVAARKRAASNTPSGATITASWTDNSDIEDGFRIYTKLTSGSTYALAKTVGANVQSTTLTGLSYGTSYDVKIASYNESGEYSQVGPVTRYTPPQYAPTSLSATEILSTEITIGFTAAAGVTSYQGYYREIGEEDWNEGPSITSGAEITFTDLTPVTEYDFKLKGFFANSSPQTRSYGPDSATLTETTELLSLGWNGEQSIAVIGDEVVWTIGTLVTSLNLGETTSRTVNGVTFTGQSTIGTLNGSGTLADFYTGGGIGAAFTALMQSLAYVEGSSNGEISLTGLDIGDTYILQVFSSDNRSSFASRNQSFAIAGYTSPPMVTGNSFAATCMFVASSTSHTLVISDPDSAGATQLQGFQLRKI
jgi:hypothetical protein